MEHWRNESIYTNPANVHNWSANAHSGYKLNQTHTSSGYRTGLQHISRDRNSKSQYKENKKLIRKGSQKYNQSQNLTWVAENYRKPEMIVSNSQNDFTKAFPHFTGLSSSWQDENVEYNRLFLLLNQDFLLETLRTYLCFLQEDGAKVLDFTGLSDETERNFVYFLNGNENQNVKSRLTGESQDLYQEILDLLEAKKDVYYILSGWSTDAKQNRTVIYTKVAVNARNQQPRGHTAPKTGRATRRTQPGRNNLTGIEFVGGNLSKDVGIPDADEVHEMLVSEEMSSANTFKTNDPNNTLKENRRGLDKPTNKLLDGLNTPVECSRAERMMHLMGWSGGALGAKGNGITEPIKPNLSMVQGRGFGHEEPSNIIIENDEKINNKEVIKEGTETYSKDFEEKERAFKTKGMELILKFLKDNSEEMVCDASLHDGERKCLHMLVESITLGLQNDKRDDPIQRTLREEIHKYEEAQSLFAESQNVNGKRQLHLYKSVLSRTRTIQKEDVFKMRNGRYDSSNDLLTRMRIFEMLLEFLEDDNLHYIKFSPEFKKYSPYKVCAVIRDLKNGSRLTKSSRKQKNIPSTKKEIHILNRIYDHPKMQLNLSNYTNDANFESKRSITKVKRSKDENVFQDKEKKNNEAKIT